MRDIPRVVLPVETARRVGLLRGIARYSRLHGPWTFHITPGDYKQLVPRIKQWGGTGIIARIPDERAARAILHSGVPTIALGPDRYADAIAHAGRPVHLNPSRRLSFVRLSIAAGLCAPMLLITGSVLADVVVLANRTGGRLTFQVQPQYGRSEQVTLPAGEVMPYFADGRVTVQFSVRGQTQSYLLGANSAYFFGRSGEGRIGLQKIGLGDDRSTGLGRPLPTSPLSTPSAVIPVKVFVDEEEPGRQFLWERRLRQRVEAASAILDKYCRVRLKVVAVGTWNSDNSITDIDDSLREFERKATPFPARLAIGFTSQYTFEPGRIHLAGTRGPLRSHILVREAARSISEPERVELLVHELGHYLGASHSPERNSVMRPVLGDHHGAGLQIRFDPVNALVIAMVGEEIRRRHVDSFADLTPGTKTRLRQIYGELAKAFPGDAATRQYIDTLDATTPRAGRPKQ
jgi:hypothetical protein